MKRQSNRKRAKGSVTTTCTSQEYESVFASTAEPNSPGVFGEGDLKHQRHYTDEELVGRCAGRVFIRFRHVAHAPSPNFVWYFAADDGHG